MPNPGRASCKVVLSQDVVRTEIPAESTDHTCVQVQG